MTSNPTPMKDTLHKNFHAEIIEDSTHKGNRITTFLLTFPRFILAEFNTHRVISRNSASSRAIPFKTMLQKVQEHPFVPLKFQKDHSGMQGTEYLDGPDDTLARGQWLRARNDAVQSAVVLNGKALSVTKQVCNRLLEPFLWHTVIATATEWENFFALRAHDAAEIHMQQIAYMMLDEYNNSTPKKLGKGEWHIPFGDRMDMDRLAAAVGAPYVGSSMVKIATARCARVSYLNFEGKDDYEADIKLCDRLSTMGHWSPFEHCAKAAEDRQYGNFRGWHQYRKTFLNENKKDPRVK